MGDEAMNKMTIGNQVILSTDDIRQWQEDIAAAERTKAEAEATISDRQRKLDAAAVFGVKIEPIPQALGVDSETMRAAVERILGAIDHAIGHYELQAELRKTPRFAEMLNKHKGAYYYTLIKRLADERPPKIKKVGKKIRLIHRDETPPEGNPEGVSRAVEG
jgi:hypothetical protein